MPPRLTGLIAVAIIAGACSDSVSSASDSAANETGPTASSSVVTSPGTGSDGDLASDTQQQSQPVGPEADDWLADIEEWSGASRHDPPSPELYEICQINGSAGLANHLGLQIGSSPIDPTEVARAYIDRVAPAETDEFRTDAYVSCLFGFEGPPLGSSSTPGMNPASDAESGLRFDVGVINEISTEDGVTHLTFDRFQAYDDQGDLVSGLTITDEVIMEPSTDFPFVNENNRLRRYPLAPGAEILVTDPAWVAGLDPVCGGDGSTVGTPIRFVTTELEADAGVASLTFNAAGEVTRIRFMLGC